MTTKDKKAATIANAVGLKPKHGDNIRVVMPNPIAGAVSQVVNGSKMPSLRYDEEAEARDSQFNWQQLEPLASEIANMIASTGSEFERTIQVIKAAGKVSDPARFAANVKVAMEDLERFTDEFIQIKAKYEGKNGFIDNATDRMLYLSVFEDFRSLATYFQGTMHHKLIEFTEYALDAKDILMAEQVTAEAQPETPAVSTTEVSNVQQ